MTTEGHTKVNLSTTKNREMGLKCFLKEHTMKENTTKENQMGRVVSSGQMANNMLEIGNKE